MLKEIIIRQLTSARFLMAILFSTTYCLVMVACTIALLMKIITVETYVALLGAFALVVREIVSDYFERKDKKAMMSYLNGLNDGSIIGKREWKQFDKNKFKEWCGV